MRNQPAHSFLVRVNDGREDLLNLIVEVSGLPKKDKAIKVATARNLWVPAVNNAGDTAMHGAAFGNFPDVVRLLADRGASADIWRRPDKLGRTPLYIAEGYRYGRPIVSRPTIDAVSSLMKAANLPTDGVRPVFKDIYEKAPEPAQKKP